MMQKKKYPLLRDPYESEMDYFKKNPHVAGMATEDEKVIFNPHSKAIPEHENSIYRNEASRVYMKKHGIKPNYELTDKQKKSFEKYGSPDDIRQTIAGRIISNDESAEDVTPDQREFVKKLAAQMLKEGWLDD